MKRYILFAGCLPGKSAPGIKGALRVGYSSADPKEGFSNSLVGAMEGSPRKGLVVGVSESWEVSADVPTHSVEFGIGNQNNVSIQEETSYTVPLRGLLDAGMDRVLNSEFTNDDAD
ncbi:MAG: hypothetical protein MJY87_00050 [Fibrobacter sp.]|nr:hypothetical protein [Fibrobacter sp.]